MAEPIEPLVKAALTDFHHRIRAVVDRGWAEWREVEEFRQSKRYGAMFYPRTIANYVFDAVARAASGEFGTDPRCRVFFEPQTIKVCFDDRVVGRFKKGDEDGLGRNIPTQAALDYTDPQQSLPGLPPEADKVEFTWAANSIGTQIETLMVVARDADRVLWAYEIAASAVGASVVEIPFDRSATGEASAGEELVAPKPKPSNEPGEA